MSELPERIHPEALPEALRLLGFDPDVTVMTGASIVADGAVARAEVSVVIELVDASRLVELLGVNANEVFAVHLTPNTVTLSVTDRDAAAVDGGRPLRLVEIPVGL